MSVAGNVPPAPNRGDPGTDRLGPTWRRFMTGLAAMGLLSLVLGGIASFRAPVWEYPPEMRDYYCREAGTFDVVPLTVWVAWDVLALASLLAMVVYLSKARRNGVVATLAILGVVAAVVTFPGWLLVLFGMDCGM